MLVKIEPDQISNVVSQELRTLYDDMKSGMDEYLNEAYLPEGMTEDQLQRALLFFIEYFTAPTEFNQWYRKDAQK